MKPLVVTAGLQCAFVHKNNNNKKKKRFVAVLIFVFMWLIVNRYTHINIHTSKFSKELLDA